MVALCSFHDTGIPAATIPGLFEQQVVAAPDAVALVFREESLTYGELDARANRLARLLVERGVGPESVVGVALRRSPELWVAVLAVLKAGGAYLPMDAAHPADRLLYMVEDSGARLVLADAETDAQLPLLPCPVVLLDSPGTAAGAAGHADTPLTGTDPTRPGHPAGAAYVIYTSGSTGRPKGVVVTHRGLAALLDTHIDRLKVTAGSRVLQFASPSFDASVWEMCMGLLSGATLVLAGKEQLAPGEPVAATIAEHGVTHVTLPPPVLATVAPGALSSVQVLVVAGDATTPELVSLWSTGRRMINAYGPTETTVCATMSAPLTADGGTPPIGRSITDTRVYVLDDRLRPAPAGVTGELYVAGASLARGYLGRPDLTAQRFVACPFDAPGGLMYRTGDLVAAAPGGDLVFHGRADTQVKIGGIRIEPLEIEAVLSGHPGVADAAVVVRDGRTGKQLVAYVVPAVQETAGRAAGGGQGTAYGSIALDSGFAVAELRSFAARHLPESMVPAAFVLLDRLPLTPNGKLDKAALPEPASRGAAYRAPRTPQEELLAGLFAETLGLDRVGIDDDFFVLGGDSIKSLQIASWARTQGVVVSDREIFKHRTVAGIAEAAAGREPGAGAAPVLEELDGGGTGWLPLLPVARWIKDWGPGFDRFLQAMVLELPADITGPGLAGALAAVLDHHDLLRSRLLPGDEGMVVGAPGSVAVEPLLRHVECAGGWDAEPGSAAAESWRALLLDELEQAARRLDPAAGVMAGFVRFHAAGPGGAGRLLVVLHHLVVDGVSWRVLMPDLADAWRQVRAGKEPELAPVATSVRRWAHALVDEASRPSRVAELDLWESIVEHDDPLLGARPLDPAVDVRSTVRAADVRLSAQVTEALLTRLPAAYRGGVNDGLLAGLALALARWRRRRGVDEAAALVRLEGHGREEGAAPGADLSRTVGWFTSAFPVRLDLTGVDLDDAFGGGPAAGEAVKRVKEHLRAVPDKGVGYGLLRHLNPNTAAVLEQYPIGQVGFNYLGRFSAAADMPEELRGLGFTQAPEAAAMPELAELDAAQDPRMPAPAHLDINATVSDTPAGPRLNARFSAPEGVLSAEEVRELADLWATAVEGLARHAADPGAGGLTPSDVPLVSVRQSEIDAWQKRFPTLSDIWPTTPLQSGLLFHSTLDEASFDAYQVQYALRLAGPVDPDRLRTAAQRVLDRHPSLRTAFVYDAEGALVQLVLEDLRMPWHYLDLGGLGDAERDTAFERFLAEDLAAHFDRLRPPLLRMSLLRMGPEAYELVLTAHHVLFDGWSVPLLMQDLLRFYGADGGAPALPRPPEYREFLAWLSRQDPEESARVWREELGGVDRPTLLRPALAAPPAGAAGEAADDAGAVADDGAVMSQAEVPLSPGTARELFRTASGLGVTLNTVVQGAWAVLLGRLTGRQDVVFASTVAGRPPAVPGVDSMVGMFLNSLPVRVRYTHGETLAELLTGLQDRQGALKDHHHYGLGDIQAATGLDALFDTIIGFESFPMDRAGIVEASREAGISITGIRSFTASHYPVSVLVFIEPDRMRLIVQYRRTVLAPAAAEAVAERFGLVLRQLAADTGRRAGAVEVLEPAERDLLLRTFEGPSADAAEATVTGLFERRAAAEPDAVAVVSDDGVRLSYRQLDERAERLALGLVRRGVGPETPVVVALPRSADRVVALLAVLKAGGCCVPVDPGHPAPGLERVLRDARPLLVLTGPGTAAALPDRGVPVLTPDRLAAEADRPGGTDRAAAPRPEGLAFLAYPGGGYGGGSEGVAVSHRAAADRLPGLAELLSAAPGTPALAGAGTDAWVDCLETFAALCSGGGVRTAGDPLDGDVTGETAGQAGGVVGTTASAVAELLDRGTGKVRADALVFTGEPLPAALARRIRAAVPGTRLVTLHGPAETGFATASTVPDGTGPADDGGLALGAPLPNTRVYVLGTALTPVPPGAVGELYVAGSTSARGYWGDGGRTAARFVADPFGPPGSRMVRTGDLVRWGADGRIEQLGSGGTDVTVRGMRFDPAAVEAVLAGYPGVAGAAVAALPGRGPGGTAQLAGYLVPAEPSGPDTGPDTRPDELRGFLARQLPGPMVPSVFTVLDRLPLRPDGSPDRSALPEPESVGRAYRAPRTPQEVILCELLAEVLGVERVGLDDDFFELGGNSLLATRLTSRIRKVLGVNVPLRAVFESHLISELSSTVRNAGTSSQPRLRKMDRSGQ
ncbi:non-ribosomal peptide synthetase [Streptacidiphilus carbonis]|uniref:non-ribosomal peptide synthetase n=1 Tax=Streptacidiphilus carbonis TaxID=105422 RepID=UPI000A06AE0B|nr:non-ribosomal peptide synthetase [Streptacidiphilus carbonis]